VRLSAQTAARLADHVAQPGYDWAAQRCGIVHLGIGAFHRAHQAAYTDAAMAAGDRDWRITGVSLRSGHVAEQLNPQDGLYTLIERFSDTVSARLIASVAGVIVAADDPQRVVDAIASAHTHIVTLTVTEKGYVTAPDGSLNLSDPALSSDMAGSGAPRTIYGYIAAGLARRRTEGLPGVTLLSCDNLADNGRHLQALMMQYLASTDAALGDWFAQHCRCPSTMIDRIVPAMTDEQRDWVAAQIGMEDAGAIITEPFSQWVIEDAFAGPRPRWEAVGAQMVADVRPHEAAKLRMLNGAHSALAYLGLARRHTYVHEAMADAGVRATIETLMRTEAAGTIDAACGIDTGAYARLLLCRFENSALPHKLIQIAMDGSQKIPQRWLTPLALNQAAGRASPATLEALAAWCMHVRGDARPVDDPMAARLAQLWAEHKADGIAAALFGPGGLFAATWQAGPADLAALTDRLTST
jgi:fructuronate reductase